LGSWASAAAVRRPPATPQVRRVAEALDYAHESNIFHRDVKADNIFLTKPRSGLRRILLGDFGIARSHDGGGLTEPGDFLGTHYYAAPEQQMGEAVDGRADQYALAVTAYELLTGSLPYAHPTIAGMINLHLNEAPPLLSRTRPDLAPLDPALAIALSKDARDRFPTCGDFARELTLANSIPRAAKTVVAPMVPSQSMPTRAARSAASTAKPPTRPFSASQQQPAPVSPQGTRPSIKTVAAVITILVLSATALFLRPWHGDVSGGGTTTSAPAATATLTFDAMRDFVTGYYHDLPAHPEEAWAKIAAAGQNETGHVKSSDFWTNIQSVTLISIVRGMTRASSRD
jgi:serine/threonine-protein kinase